MSLSAAALRIAAIEALRGATFAGASVVDTNGIVEDNGADGPRFVIIVGTSVVEPRNVVVSVTLRMFVRTIIETAAGGLELHLATPATSGPAELALDLLAEEVRHVLGGAHDAWPVAFRALAGGTLDTVIERSAEDATAVRTLTYHVAEPRQLDRDRVAAVPESWRLFLKGLSASEHLAGQAALFQPRETAAPPDWASIGLTGFLTAADAAEIMGIAPQVSVPLAVEPAVAPPPRRAPAKPQSTKRGGAKRSRAAA